MVKAEFYWGVAENPPTAKEQINELMTGVMARVCTADYETQDKVFGDWGEMEVDGVCWSINVNRDLNSSGPLVVEFLRGRSYSPDEKYQIMFKTGEALEILEEVTERTQFSSNTMMVPVGEGFETEKFLQMLEGSWQQRRESVVIPDLVNLSRERDKYVVGGAPGLPFNFRSLLTGAARVVDVYSHGEDLVDERLSVNLSNDDGCLGIDMSFGGEPYVLRVGGDKLDSVKVVAGGVSFDCTLAGYGFDQRVEISNIEGDGDQLNEIVARLLSFGNAGYWLIDEVCEEYLVEVSYGQANPEILKPDKLIELRDSGEVLGREEFQEALRAAAELATGRMNSVDESALVAYEVLVKYLAQDLSLELGQADLVNDTRFKRAVFMGLQSLTNGDYFRLPEISQGSRTVWQYEAEQERMESDWVGLEELLAENTIKFWDGETKEALDKVAEARSLVDETDIDFHAGADLGRKLKNMGVDVGSLVVYLGCGGGWTCEGVSVDRNWHTQCPGLVAAGYRVVGFDIEANLDERVGQVYDHLKLNLVTDGLDLPEFLMRVGFDETPAAVVSCSFVGDNSLPRMGDRDKNKLVSRALKWAKEWRAETFFENADLI